MAALYRVCASEFMIAVLRSLKIATTSLIQREPDNRRFKFIQSFFRTRFPRICANDTASIIPLVDDLIYLSLTLCNV